MSDIRNKSLKLKRPPTDELPSTRSTAKSNFCDFSHYITASNSSDTNLTAVPDSIRSYFVLYVKQLQSVDGMLDLTRHQLELFVNASILHKFNAVVETIRCSLKTFTDELIDQISQSKDDLSVESDNSPHSAVKPKKWVIQFVALMNVV